MPEPEVTYTVKEMLQRMDERADERHKQVTGALADLTTRLDNKADAGIVLDLTHRLDGLDRGDFSEVHKRALASFIDQRVGDRSSKVWSRRQQIITGISAIGGIGTAILYVLIAIKGGVFG